MIEVTKDIEGMHWMNEKKPLKTTLLFSAGLLFTVNAVFASKAFEFAPCEKVAPFAKKNLPVPNALKSAQCGFLVVPENRSNLKKGTIRLAVVILKASSNDAKEPVVYLAGGPGGSAILEMDTLINDGINQNHPLILMSQRGTLFSEPELMCPELDAFYQKSLSLPLDSKTNRTMHMKASKDCYLRLSKQRIDFNAYNTVENAADFAKLRTALGIKTWNVYGVSYGTYLAQTLMYQHPEGIRSVTLDSVVPLKEARLVAMASQNAAEALNTLFKACKAQTHCNNAYPNLSEQVTKLIRKLELKPAIETIILTPKTKPIKAILDGGAFLNWLIDESFNTPNLPNLPLLIDQLYKGHTKAIIEARAQSALTPPNVLAYGMTFGMLCSGYIAEESPKDVLTQGRLAFPKYPESVLKPSLHYSYVHDDCLIWKIKKTLKDLRTPTISTIPTLLFSGSFDAITPPSTGKIAADTLSNARILTIPGVGHGVIHASECAKMIFKSFLANPNSPTLDCLKKINLPVFN